MRPISRFVISLDFELFWGVAESRSISEYQDNVAGEWTAIPRILNLFKQRGVKATWATVGMLMCRDYKQWRELRPSRLPEYDNPLCSTYNLENEARQHPKLFFGRPLVEKILGTPGQELGGHSYSHFYCDEPGVAAHHFAADLECAREVSADFGVCLRSFVFPRNQIRAEFLKILNEAGYESFRGNPKHQLYATGHQIIGGRFMRGIRLADSYFPISGHNIWLPERLCDLVNCQASVFLRPWSAQLTWLDALRLRRIKRAMHAAAQSGKNFHLWWHPHNFGVNTDQNLEILTEILNEYAYLRDHYGMLSSTMQDVTGGLPA